MDARLLMGEWVERCIEAEVERGASASSVAECGRCLRRAAKAFAEQGIEDVWLLTAARLSISLTPAVQTSSRGNIT